MKLIGITQRVDVVVQRNERRDCLDQDWARLLDKCGCLGIALPNNPATALAIWDSLPFDGLLLTGGNDLAALGGMAPERDETEHGLLARARRGRKPTLGVCRGMQMIQTTFGIGLRKVDGHVARQHDVTIDDAPVVVNSFHAWATADTAPALEVWARAHDGTVEAIRHRSEPIVGMMWHPERYEVFRAFDIALIKNHFGTG